VAEDRKRILGSTTARPQRTAFRADCANFSGSRTVWSFRLGLHDCNQATTRADTFETHPANPKHGDLGALCVSVLAAQGPTSSQHGQAASHPSNIVVFIWQTISNGILTKQCH